MSLCLLLSLCFSESKLNYLKIFKNHETVQYNCISYNIYLENLNKITCPRYSESVKLEINSPRIIFFWVGGNFSREGMNFILHRLTSHDSVNISLTNALTKNLLTVLLAISLTNSVTDKLNH